MSRLTRTVRLRETVSQPDEGDIVKTVGKAFPRDSRAPDHGLTSIEIITLTADFIPPIIFNGAIHPGANTQRHAIPGYGEEKRRINR